MKFSVLLPTRNRLDLLAMAIQSVRSQSYDNWEIIVSDNCSEEDVAGQIKSLRDSRIKYFRTTQFIPVTDNWNNALDKSVGDYIIMLGDDDCLMQGYFFTLCKLIEKYNAPDFIYTDAFLYAYPGVIPGIKEGQLRKYSNRKIFQSAHKPFWLERTQAIEFAKDSMNFKVTFDYNMQFSLVSRKLIEKMKRYGQFYQSPYPDYYASNAMMLKADRILIVPYSLVTIGISSKSFGFFYFNDAESEGNEFLNNLPDMGMVKRLQNVILPGTAMNTSWLLSMETLAVNFSNEFEINVNYARYRIIQICAIYAGLILDKKGAQETYLQLQEKMSRSEKLRLGLWFSTLYKIVPGRYRVSLAHRIQEAGGSHPKIDMPSVAGEFNTILDVFNKIDPLQ